MTNAAASRLLNKTDVLGVFVIGWLAAMVYRSIWPLIHGRDFDTYVWYYVEMWQQSPAQPFLMVYRTPLTPVFIGVLSEVGGMLALTVAMNTLYAVAVTAAYCLGAFWSRAIGWASVAVTIVYVGFGALYREVSSDVLFGSAFLSWCAWVAWTHQRSTPAAYVAHAVWVVVLTLIRPASQAYLLFAIFPWVVSMTDARARLRCAAAFLGTAVGLLGAYSTYNAIRYQDFTVARGGNAINPFYRAFMTARIVREGNGPASRELADAVRADLLVHEPYRSYGVTDQMLFEDGDARAWSDLLALSDRRWGWDSDYAILRRAALEAVAANPAPFVAGVARDMVAMLAIIGYPPPTVPRPSAPPASSRPTPPDLPVPTDGQRVPFSYVHWLSSSPTGNINASAQEHSRARVARIVATIPANPGKPETADLLEKAQRLFPPPGVWLLAGVIGTIRLSGVQRRVFYLLVAMALIAPTAGVVGQALLYHYRLPTDPLFIVFGVAGFWRAGLGRTFPQVS